MVKNKKIAIIGAGPAGLATAYQLAKAGVEVEVFEAGPVVGGMARSLDLWQQRVDLGPHRFFSSDRRVNELWLEVVGRDYRLVNRLTRIYYRGKFFFYPLKPMNALRNLGVWESALCVLSYVRERMQIFSTVSKKDTFEGWVVSRFGRRLFEIFFKTYSEKLWGIPCTSLDSDFASQRIKKLSLFEAVKNAFLGGAKNEHKTLADRFAYPLGGTGAVYEKMADKIRGLGGKVHLRSPVQGVTNDGNRVRGLKFSDGSVQEFDHIISTMPLTQLLFSLSGIESKIIEAARELTFRNSILVYLEVNATNLFPDNWIYVHSGELKTGRITNFRNWVPELYGASDKTILTMEYWCDSDDAVWKEDDTKLIDQAKSELRSTGLIGKAEIIRAHVERIPRCYPVYRQGYKEKLSLITACLDQFDNLSLIGRYGSFKYNNQDHSLLMGILAAENITGPHTHNLWNLNTDYETYLEKATITESGMKNHHVRETKNERPRS